MSTSPGDFADDMIGGYVIIGARWDRRVLRRIHRKQVLVWYSNDGKTWRRMRRGVRWVDNRVTLKPAAAARLWRLVYRTGDVVVTPDPTATTPVGEAFARTFYLATPAASV